jgi:hypothetical protein
LAADVKLAGMQWLWRSLEIILPASLIGLLLSGLGIASCYGMVLLRRRKEGDLPASITRISSWSTRLAWFSFALFWSALMGAFVVTVIGTIFYPDTD